MGTIIFGHPRSRSSLICSHIEGFPSEIFHLDRINPQGVLEWDKQFDASYNIYSGVADRYLEKIKAHPPHAFKIFGFHLDTWPQCFNYIQSLQYQVVRVYRRNQFEAIISFLLGYYRGWTSMAQKPEQSFEVPLRLFMGAYHLIVVQDQKWAPKFKFDIEIEYNDVLTAIRDGHLEKYGISARQLYPLKDQKSIPVAKILIKNMKEVENWYDNVCKQQI